MTRPPVAVVAAGTVAKNFTQLDDYRRIKNIGAYLIANNKYALPHSKPAIAVVVDKSKTTNE